MLKNNSKKNNHKRGFVKIVIIVVAALVLLKYVYDLDIIGFLTEGKFKVFLDKFYELSVKAWQKYNGLVTTIWGYIIEFLKNIVAKIK